MRLEDLLGRRVRYRGEEGRVVEGHLDPEACILISVPARPGAPSRGGSVPMEERGELGLLR